MVRLKNTITGDQMFSEWNTDPTKLSYLILKHDLTVLRPFKIPVLARFLPLKRLRSDSKELLETISDHPRNLYQLLFLKTELEKIPLEPRPQPPQPPPIATPKLAEREPAEDEKDRFGPIMEKLPDPWDPLEWVIEDHEPQIKGKLNVFWLMGKVWYVKFAKSEWGLYPDQEKYRYIARLLSLCDSPKTRESEYSIYNAELYVRVSGKRISKNIEADGEVMRELNESDLSDKLSADDLRRIKELGYDLLEKLKEGREAGNEEFIQKALDNIDKYRSHLSNEYGIKAAISKDEKRISFHQYYRPSKEIEKLRQVVKNQISNAIKDFDRMPAFRSHLQHSLKVKSDRTIYSPEQPTVWYVSM